MTKEFRKAVMKRARLRNVYLKKRIEATKAANNYQRNICVSLLRISKRSYFENLNVKLVRSNKKFSNDKKVAETFQEFLTNFVKSLNISQNPYLCSGPTQTDPVFQFIEKLPKHPDFPSNLELSKLTNFLN